MVAVLVRLRLSLLRAGFRRSVWRAVGLILALIYAAGLVGLAILALVVLRVFTPQFVGPVTLLAFSVVTIGWLMLPLLFFGVDETLDPARFALLPVRARDLQPGLLVSGLLSTPGIAFVLVLLGYVAAWSTSGPAMLAAALSAPLGVVTCFLLARTGTAGFAALLRTRKVRDASGPVLAVLIASVAIGVNVATGQRAPEGAAFWETLAGIAAVVGWTPVGWVWAIPVAVDAGNYPAAALHAGLAVGLAALLWWGWGRLLDRALCQPVDAGGTGAAARRSRGLDLLGAAGAVGAVAARCLRYWRRDPRYAAQLLPVVILPVALVATTLASQEVDRAVVALAPVLAAVILGGVVVQDLGFDGTALRLHAASGITGRQDRWGRLVALAVIAPAPLLALVFGSAWYSGRPDLAVPLLAATIALFTGSAAAGSWVGALLPVPQPAAGANPFTTSSGGGLRGLLAFSLAQAIALLCAVPTGVLVVIGLSVPWASWVALAVSLGIAAATIPLGVRVGGDRLDRHWPEVLRDVAATP